MHRKRPFTTLGQFIIDQEKEQSHIANGIKGNFSQLLRDIVLACKFVHREVNRAGLTDILGAAGNANIHGEEVKKLDLFANEHLKRSLKNGGTAAIIASEEEDDCVILNDESGDYVVLFDPLDGSSNIDVNISVGTIFSIYKRVSAYGNASLADCLQAGVHQICAGYVIYGSSTILAYTTGNGVHVFTFEPSLGDFFLWKDKIEIPQNALYISVNDMQFEGFNEHVKSYIHDVRRRNMTNTQTLTPRYVGSLVADFHRNLLKGGIFMYPGTHKKTEGKLRLLYEANPMAFIIQQAKGMATDGINEILQIKPKELHQRTPLIIGSPAEVEKFMTFSSLAVKP